MLFVHVSSQKDGPAKADPKRKKKAFVAVRPPKRPCCIHAPIWCFDNCSSRSTSPLIQSVEVKSKKHRVSTQLNRNLFTLYPPI